MRIFDVDTPLQEICELKPGQTPNVDVLRPAVDWTTAADWEATRPNYLAQVVADIEIATAGAYTFRLESDEDRSCSSTASVVIDHDGIHGARRRTATSPWRPARTHLEIDYFQAGGAQRCSCVEASWPDHLRAVPTSVLRPRAAARASWPRASRSARAYQRRRRRRPRR